MVTCTRHFHSGHIRSSLPFPTALSTSFGSGTVGTVRAAAAQQTGTRVIVGWKNSSSKMMRGFDLTKLSVPVLTA